MCLALGQTLQPHFSVSLFASRALAIGYLDFSEWTLLYWILSAKNVLCSSQCPLFFFSWSNATQSRYYTQLGKPTVLWNFTLFFKILILSFFLNSRNFVQKMSMKTLKWTIRVLYLRTQHLSSSASTTNWLPVTNQVVNLSEPQFPHL